MWEKNKSKYKKMRKKTKKRIVSSLKSTFLCIRFPFLNTERGWKDHVRPIQTVTWLGAMPIGWRKRFGIDFCKELKKAILSSGGREYMRTFHIIDLKEKYGSLNVYTSGATPEVERVIEKYEYISQFVCVDCGKDAVKKTYRGWICPYCEDCLPKDSEWIWINPIYGWSDLRKEEYNKNKLGV